MSGDRVVVVGGGLAGIAAALSCADDGLEVTLVERRRRLGGLTCSVRRNGLSVDNGQHVFLRCCSAYRSFLDRLGAGDQVRLQKRLDLPVLAPTRSTLADTTGQRRRRGREAQDQVPGRASISACRLPAPFHLAPSLISYRHLGIRERLLLGWAAFGLGRVDPSDPDMDEVAFGDWLRRHGQSDRAIDRLWNLIALPTLNVRAEEASLALAAKVFRTGLLEQADAGDIGWSAVPLGELHGANAMRALEAAGVEVRLGTKVSAVEGLPARAGSAGSGAKGRTDRGARTGERSGFQVLADSGRIQSPFVVIATPPAVAATLTSAVLTSAGGDDALAHSSAVSSLENAAKGLGSSPVVNVHLWFDRQVTDLELFACVDSPVQYVFDRTRSSGAPYGQFLSLSISGADGELPVGSAELVRTFSEALGEVLPASRRAHLVDGFVTREPDATFRARPGTATLRPGTRTANAGLILAGSWCATGWPATMEGAVRSGLSAASEIRSDAAGTARASGPGHAAGTAGTAGAAAPAGPAGANTPTGPRTLARAVPRAPDPDSEGLRALEEATT